MAETPEDKLLAAIAEFDEAVADDPRYRRACQELHTVSRDIERTVTSGEQEHDSPGRRAAREAADDDRGESEGDDKRPTSFRDARERSRKRFADSGGRDDDRTSDERNSRTAAKASDAVREEATA